MMIARTDYPFQELGDVPGKVGPVRQVTVLSYDGDKYARILVEGFVLEVKAGYLMRNEPKTESLVVPLLRTCVFAVVLTVCTVAWTVARLRDL